MSLDRYMIEGNQLNNIARVNECNDNSIVDGYLFQSLLKRFFWIEHFKKVVIRKKGVGALFSSNIFCDRSDVLCIVKYRGSSRQIHKALDFWIL